MAQNPLTGLKQAFPPAALSQQLVDATGGPPPGPTDVESLIQQRQGINSALSGHPAPPQAPPVGNPYPGQPTGWHPPMAPGRIPEPWGAMDGLTGAAPGQEEAPMDFDALIKAAQALQR